jgi:hypothetical protein
MAPHALRVSYRVKVGPNREHTGERVRSSGLHFRVRISWGGLAACNRIRTRSMLEQFFFHMTRR